MNQKSSPWLVALVLVLGAMVLLRPSEAAPKTVRESDQALKTSVSQFIPNDADGYVVVTSGTNAFLLRKFGSSLTQVSKVELK
jgi:hypothetical protein